MRKKSLAVLITMAMILSMTVAAVFASEFSDMPDDWSTAALENAVANGLITGYNGKIMPDDNLTRAQMAVIVNRAFGAANKASLSGYTDVAVDAWYYDEMAKAVQMKTFVGSGGKLNPDSDITREEAFVVLARAFMLSGAAESALDRFSDKASVSQWAEDGVSSLIAAGYIAGSNGRINPKQYITRAEFAQMMDNLLKNYIKAAGTFTTDFNGNVMINAPDVMLKNLAITGDLIIGNGVGNGKVTLDSVSITGRTVICNGADPIIVISGPPAPGALKVADYFPMKENVRYVYEGMGNEFASYDVFIDYIADGKVQQRVNNGGTETAKVVELKEGKLIKLLSRGETYYRENLLSEEGVDEEILLMEPLAKGITWALSDSRVRTITGTSVEVTTPAGSYKTIEVMTAGPHGKTIDYYAINVGLIKSIFIYENNEITSSLSKIEENVSLIQRINFYYPNINDGKYYYKSKDISFMTNDITRKILEKAYKEAASNNVGKVFSINTEINSLYLNKDGMVYIDLNRAFMDEMNAGSLYEAMILQCVANTFGQYYNIEKIILTIDNNLYESGHIELSKWEYIEVNYENTVEIK